MNPNFRKTDLLRRNQAACGYADVAASCQLAGSQKKLLVATI